MEGELREGLERLGLSEREARVFLALLSRPGSSAQDLAEEVRIPRATCYDILSELITGGFATVGEGEFGRRYFPHPPERILALFENERKKIEGRLQEAVAIVPLLNVLYSPLGPRPRVRYREGMRGLKSLHAEYALLEGEYLQIFGLDAFSRLHDEAVTAEYREGLTERTPRIRAIVVTDHPERVAKIPNLEVAVLPTSLWNLQGEMTVCGDRVAFFSYKDDIIAVEIHSPQIALVCRAALELAWKQAQDMERIFQKENRKPPLS